MLMAETLFLSRKNYERRYGPHNLAALDSSREGASEELRVRGLQSGRQWSFNPGRKVSRFGLALVAVLLATGTARAQLPAVRNAAGLRISVSADDTNPALTVTVPDGPADQRSFKILLPEHVTVRAHGETEAKHLYIYRPGAQGDAPQWKKIGTTLEYARDFGDIHFVAHATLADDGILFHYEFVNHSATSYDMVTAVTDPRFSNVFYDPRLERTYVHYSDGFALLADETPARLTVPLNAWFPVRYLASYTAPIPVERVQHRSDGITYRYSARAVDTPMIATLSQDGKWVAASFARSPGNVWSNPELTCQHVDPDVPLLHDGHAQYKVKILIFKGTLENALDKVGEQRKLLK
jgi:hypothetical protein